MEVKEKYVIDDFQNLNFSKDYMFKEGVGDLEVIQELMKVVVGEEYDIVYCDAEKAYYSGLNSGVVVCDLMGLMRNQGIIDLEMQGRITKDLIRRAQTYVSVLIGHSNQKGAKDYRECPHCYSIWFTCGDVVESKKPISWIEYRDRDGIDTYDSAATIVFCNIERWNEMEGDMSKLCHFLLESTYEVYLQSKCRVVELLYQRITEMKQNIDEEERYMRHEYEIKEALEQYQEEHRIKHEHEIQEALEQYREESKIKHEHEMQEALEQYREESKIKHEHEMQENQKEIVLNMVKENCKTSLIAKVVKLPEEVINKIIQENVVA